MTINEFNKIKKRISTLKSEVDIAKGKHDAAVEQLKKIGFDSIDDAQKVLNQLDAKIKDVKEQFEIAHHKFEEKYGERL